MPGSSKRGLHGGKQIDGHSHAGGGGRAPVPPTGGPRKADQGHDARPEPKARQPEAETREGTKGGGEPGRGRSAAGHNPHTRAGPHPETREGNPGKRPSQRSGWARGRGGRRSRAERGRRAPEAQEEEGEQNRETKQQGYSSRNTERGNFR